MNDLSAQVSNAYSLTDNLLIFDDYNIDQFNKKEKELLDNFASGLALNPTNVDTPTCITKTNQLLIDHWFKTKRSNCRMKSLFAPIEVDHNIIFYQSKLERTGRNEDRFFFLKEHDPFSGEKFNSEVTFADWRPNYQQDNCE